MSLEKYESKEKQSNMTITSVKEHVHAGAFDQVQVKEMGDIIEIRYLSDKIGRNYN